jgi:hypothetical protein
VAQFLERHLKVAFIAIPDVERNSEEIRTNMWTCPQCNAQFVQKNLWQSCGNYSVEGFLKGKSERGKQLFWWFVKTYEEIGPIKLHPVKGRVAFMVKVRFSGVNKVGADFIEGGFWLKEKIDSDKFFKVEKLTESDFIHRFRIHDETFNDDEFVK